MEQLAKFLQAVGFHIALIQPLLPMYIHLIVSALFSIYTGAHASLSRPSSAAKSTKQKKYHDEDEEPEERERERKMEGLSPSDAIMLPLFGGLSLAGLYFLIKWLEDPAVLNTLLNWYFSLFGVLSLARLLNDVMTFAHSFIFPAMYVSDGKLWKINSKQKKAKSLSTNPTDSISWDERNSPLPGPLSTFAFPPLERRILWALKKLPARKFHIRAYIHNIAHGDFKIGSHGITAILLALNAQLYFNLADKPWWLTNLLGFSVAYSVLQIMTPTTSWTGTLILGGLFIYDIYFVFFTPLMVTVATKLDIPAKLIFPRPAGPGGKPGFSMLGLGDVVLPGMMIGFALRFDLYLFYLRKQTQKAFDKVTDTEHSDSQQQIDTRKENKPKDTQIVKGKWLQATGKWGERYWTKGTDIELPESLQGGFFPKTYFHASLIGYVVGMVFTLLVMQIFGHAQPALLYLVPGTLGALWGTALINGDIKTLWAYTEADEEEEVEKKRKAKTENADKENERTGFWAMTDWIKDSFLLGFNRAKDSKESGKESHTKDTTSNGQPRDTKKDSKTKKSNDDDDDDDKIIKGFPRHRKSELIFFSINMPQDTSSSTSIDTDSTQLAGKNPASQKNRDTQPLHDVPAASDEQDSDSVGKRSNGTRMRKIEARRDLGETY